MFQNLNTTLLNIQGIHDKSVIDNYKNKTMI